MNMNEFSESEAELLSSPSAAVVGPFDPGHDRDLEFVSGGRSAVAALVERESLFTVFLALPPGRTSMSVTAALTSALSKLSHRLAASLTWDQGKEMAGHEALLTATGIPINFCRQSSPW